MLVHARIELLPDPGNCEEGRGTHLFDGLRKASDVLLVVHSVAADCRRQEAHDLLSDMRQRKIGDHTVFGTDGDDVYERPGHERQGLVRQHDSLGRTGRARGVDEGRTVARSERIHPLVQVRVGDLATAPDELSPGQSPVACMVAHEHHVVQTGQLGTLGQDLVELLLILDQNNGRLGMVDDVSALLRRVRRIDPGRSRTDRHGGNVEDDPFRLVGSEDGHRHSGFDAERDQCFRSVADLGHILGPTRRHPSISLAHRVRSGRASLGTFHQDSVSNGLELHRKLPRTDRRTIPTLHPSR